MDIKKIIAEFKDYITNIYGSNLINLILYGSYARNEAAENSDIDLLVVLKGKIMPGRKIDRMIEGINDLNLKYNVLLSVYPISENEYTKNASPFLMNIRREGVLA